MQYTCEKHAYVYSEGGSCPYCDINDAAESSKAKMTGKAAELEQRKRDRFELAKAAMQGLCANACIISIDGTGVTIVADLEVIAIDRADKMLALLEKGGES